MNERVKRLAEEAKKLTHDERVELYEELLISLYDEDREDWQAELDRRSEAYLSGKDKGYDAVEAVDEIRERLAKRPQ